MPWMRVAIGVGGAGLVAGVAGMILWIDDTSHYFELAAALASAGFLTLVACFLTSVFGSSHGSQDDAFRRGRSMGYDEGFLEGHRTARPVVVPLHGVGPGVDHDLEVASSDIDREDERDDELASPPVAMPMWHRDAKPLSRPGARDRIFDWVAARRVVLVAGVMCLALIGVIVANASVPAAGSAEALAPGTQSLLPAPPSGSTPAVVSKTGRSGWSVSVGTGGTLLVPGVAGAPPVVPGLAGAALAAQAIAHSGSLASGLPGVGVVGSSPVYSPPSLPVFSPPAVTPVTPPTVVPVVAPAVPLTAAEQTAADAAAAAALTAANAKAAADLTAANALAAANLTAANAAAAAAETARVAAAAAEATKLKAAADAYAVAHPS